MLCHSSQHTKTQFAFLAGALALATLANAPLGTRQPMFIPLALRAICLAIPLATLLAFALHAILRHKSEDKKLKANT